MNQYYFPGWIDTALGHEHWAIYDVIHNRFVIVADNRELLTRTLVMLSGKTQLYLVNLQQAANYSQELLDNSCCGHWGLDSVQGANLFGLARDPQDLEIAVVPDLIQLEDPAPEIHAELQNFAFLAYAVASYWHKTLEWFYRDYYDFVDWPQPLQTLKRQEQASYRAIYRCTDYHEAESTVQSIMQDRTWHQ